MPNNKLIFSAMIIFFVILISCGNRNIQKSKPTARQGILDLRKWNFDDDLILVAEECGDWSRDNEGPADLCDLVLVANYLGLMKNDRNNSLPHVDSMPAIAKLAITPEDSISAIKESSVVRRNIKKLCHISDCNRQAFVCVEIPTGDLATGKELKR